MKVEELMVEELRVEELRVINQLTVAD